MDDIPNELLLHILADVSARDLLRCQQVSRKWKDVIYHASELQYKIDLEKYGYKDDGASCIAQSSASSTTLHKMQEAWLRLGESPQARPRPPPITFSLPLLDWDINDDIHMRGHSLIREHHAVADDWDKTFDFFDLTDLTAAQNSDTTVPFRRLTYNPGEHNTHDSRWYYDPEQRLMVFVVADDVAAVRNVTLHVLLLHDEHGTEDGNTAFMSYTLLNTFPVMEYLPMEGTTMSAPTTTIQISGEFLLLHRIVMSSNLARARLQETSLAVCLWRSGEVLQRWVDNEDRVYVDGILARGEYLLMLHHDRFQSNPVTSETCCRLDVYLLRVNPPTGIDRCMLVSTFELPSMNPLYMQISDVWETSQRPRSLPFVHGRIQASLSSASGTPSPQDTLVLFNIWYYPQGVQVALFAPLSTLVRDASKLHQLGPSSASEPKKYPWSTWGPHNTRCRIISYPFLVNPGDLTSYPNGNPVYLSGFRALLHKGEGIMDFNPYNIFRFSSGEPLPAGSVLVESSIHIMDSSLFKDRVTTSLPFLWIPLSAFAIPDDDPLIRWFFFQDAEGLKVR
ncbi:hypothetical protein K474DRAFT_1092419 [Panus rudis PR-1116 ss-1]|nr:hypothetical protein K474DRAFT_1092419 [Panus rudis PR-1116 ss-1]